MQVFWHFFCVLSDFCSFFDTPSKEIPESLKSQIVTQKISSLTIFFYFYLRMSLFFCNFAPEFMWIHKYYINCIKSNKLYGIK